MSLVHIGLKFASFVRKNTHLRDGTLWLNDGCHFRHGHFVDRLAALSETHPRQAELLTYARLSRRDASLSLSHEELVDAFCREFVELLFTAQPEDQEGDDSDYSEEDSEESEELEPMRRQRDASPPRRGFLASDAARRQRELASVKPEKSWEPAIIGLHFLGRASCDRLREFVSRRALWPDPRQARLALNSQALRDKFVQHSPSGSGLPEFSLTAQGEQCYEEILHRSKSITIS